MRVMSYLAAMMLMAACSKGQSLEQEAYNICPVSGTHQFQPLKNNGIIKFESLNTIDISCSVNLQFNFTEIASVTFTFEADCYHRTCPLPAKIEIMDYNFCPSSTTSYTPTLEGNGLLPLIVFGNNQPPLKPFRLRYETLRKSTCIQTIKIQGSLYSTYKQSLQSPFYSEVGQYNTPCNHTFIGIPSGSYVSFFMPIANLHSTSASWIYATPRNSTTFLYYNHPLIAHVGTGTSATLQMPGISDSSWRFTYEFRVLICEDPPEVEHATYESQTWFNGTTVTYTCDSGYTLADNSASNLTCTLLDGYLVAWDTAKIECIPESTCGPAPVFAQTTRVLSNGGLTAKYTCGGSFSNPLGDTDYTLECSSPDSERLSVEWRPTNVSALLCTSTACPTTEAPTTVTTPTTTACPACPACAITPPPTPRPTCPTTEVPTTPTTTACPACTTVTCPDVTTATCPTVAPCPRCPVVTCPRLTCPITTCPTTPTTSLKETSSPSAQISSQPAGIALIVLVVLLSISTTVLAVLYIMKIRQHSAGNGSKDRNLESLEFDNKAMHEEFDEDTGFDNQAATYVNNDVANGRSQGSKSPTETKKSLSPLEKELTKTVLSRKTSNSVERYSAAAKPETKPKPGPLMPPNYVNVPQQKKPS